MTRVTWIVIASGVLMAGACGGDDDDDGGDDDTVDATAIDVAVDATPTIDTAVDVCTTCTSDEICVQSYNGTCGGGVAACVAKTADCPNNACSTECEAAYCSSPYQCENRAPCGGESPLAFTCYGP